MFNINTSSEMHWKWKENMYYFYQKNNSPTRFKAIKPYWDISGSNWILNLFLWIEYFCFRHICIVYMCTLHIVLMFSQKFGGAQIVSKCLFVKHFSFFKWKHEKPYGQLRCLNKIKFKFSFDSRGNFGLYSRESSYWWQMACHNHTEWNYRKYGNVLILCQFGQEMCFSCSSQYWKDYFIWLVSASILAKYKAVSNLFQYTSRFKEKWMVHAHILHKNNSDTFNSIIT